MRLLVAFDKFKGSLGAAEACRIAAEVVGRRRPDWEVLAAPLTDGGEGFAEILTAAAGGEMRATRVFGPRGAPVMAGYGLVETEKLKSSVRHSLALPDSGPLAVVEMAEASGLQLLGEEARNVWACSSYGTGELLLSAAATRPAAILLGVGGSATHDLGLGALQALGLRGRFRGGIAPSAGPLSLAPENWDELAGFQGEPQPLPPLWLASDVENRLLGERGAAAVFAPQKGLAPGEISQLEAATERAAHLLCGHFQQPVSRHSEPGSGAAGGIALGLRLACGARRISGFSLVREWLDLDGKLDRADMVVTGEGCFDASSLEGKGPGELVAQAQAQGKRCVVLAGRIELSRAAMETHRHCRFRSIAGPGRSPAESRAQAARFLREALEALVDERAGE